MSNTKQMTRSKRRKYQPSASKVSNKSQESTLSESDSENSEWSPSSERFVDRSSFRLLSEMRKSMKHRFTLVHAQSAAALGIVALAVYFVLEPVLSFKRILSSSKDSPKVLKPPTFRVRVSYVLLNSSYSLMGVLLVELYKEYLRMLSYAQSSINASLDDQMKLNGRIKMAERAHIRSLSQFVLMLFCLLSFAFNPKLFHILERIALAFNYLYLLGQIADICQPRRLKMFTIIVVYVPLFICLLFIVQEQLYKTLQVFLS